MFHILLLIAVAATTQLATSVADAQAVRAVIVAKQANEGLADINTGLDAAASTVLSQSGLRIVELDSALRAQRHALSDKVQSGQLPNELTVLNADVVVSLQLRCSQSSGGVLGTPIHAQFCVLDSKVISSSVGDVLFARSHSFTTHGLNTQMAIQSLLEKRVPEVIATDAKTWLDQLVRADDWEIDLSVAGLNDRETGRAIAKQLAHLPGVSSVRLLSYDRVVSKYVVAGHGREALEALPCDIEADSKLSLVVTYETARSLHAEFSLAKAYKQRVMAMSVVPRDSVLEPVAGEVMRAALMNLPYLEMAHTLPLLAAADHAQELEKRLRAKARSLGVRLLIAGSFAPDAHGWLAALKLIESDSGRTLAAASGSAESSTEALDAAVRAFDDRVRVSLGQAAVRARLGLPDLAKQLAHEQRLVIQAFTLPDGTSKGSLSVKNASSEPLRGGSVELRTSTGELSTQKLPELAPHAQLTVPLAFASRDLIQARRLTANVSYERGGAHSKSTAVLARGSALPEHVEQSDDYREAQGNGRRLRNAGDWEGARIWFQRAADALPNAQILRELGLVELDIGDQEAALRHLREALRSTTWALDSDQRSDLERLVHGAELSQNTRALRRNEHARSSRSRRQDVPNL